MAIYTPAKVLILVRAYPTPARKGIEVSCTAAVTEDGQWVRLFPVPYRYLDGPQRFRKYQWVEMRIARATSDARPESYTPDAGSIRVLTPPLPTDHNWRARREIVRPLMRPSLCQIQADRDAHKFPTLGIFKPKVITRLIIEKARANWTATEQARLDQSHMFLKPPNQQLQKIPFRFIYEFVCDEPGCATHKLMCSDWELAALYRNCRASAGDGWEQPFRQRAEHEMVHKFDTHFYVGTVHGHPGAWIIVGLFYPPRDKGLPGTRYEQPSLL